MNLQEVFDQLTAGELSQVSIGGSAVGSITEANYKAMVGHVNLGLTALYKRFHLKEGRVRLDLTPGVTTYTLHSKFAKSNTRSRETIKYLADGAANKFQDDLLKVERVLTDSEFELDLNNLTHPYSVHTPTATKLRVHADIVAKKNDLPEVLKTDQLEIVYRANHYKISNEDVEPELVELELPDAYLEALLLYVASRIHNPIGMGQEFNAGNTYAAKYEAACMELEMKNLRVDLDSQSNKLTERGWV